MEFHAHSSPFPFPSLSLRDSAGASRAFYDLKTECGKSNFAWLREASVKYYLFMDAFICFQIRKLS
jgi:hypothetical protein